MRLAPRCVALVALALAGTARAEDAPFPLTTYVGQAVSICQTGTIQCPAAAPICDDLGIATPVEGPQGLAFQGVAPGTTLCSAGSAGGAGIRRVYRVTVTARPAQPPARP